MLHFIGGVTGDFTSVEKKGLSKFAKIIYKILCLNAMAQITVIITSPFSEYQKCLGNDSDLSFCITVLCSVEVIILLYYNGQLEQP